MYNSILDSVETKKWNDGESNYSLVVGDLKFT